MSTGRMRILVVAIAATLVSGCYGKRLYEIESRLDSQDWQLASLRDSVNTIAAGVAHLDSMVGDQSAPLRTTGARLESRLDELETRLEMNESMVRETRQKVSRLGVSGASGQSPGLDSTIAARDNPEPAPGVAQSIYEAAYVDFARGDFESAISGFRDFVERFPANDYSDDAQFMVGQAYFARGTYANAIPEFRKVLDRYPSGDRVPQAMYSLGLSYMKIQDVETAREYFRILSARYPNAGEAARAKAMLDSLATGRGSR
jgi:tol-pal system protein YbgF